MDKLLPAESLYVMLSTFSLGIMCGFVWKTALNFELLTFPSPDITTIIGLSSTINDSVFAISDSVFLIIFRQFTLFQFDFIFSKMPYVDQKCIPFTKTFCIIIMLDQMYIIGPQHNSIPHSNHTYFDVITNFKAFLLIVFFFF